MRTDLSNAQQELRRRMAEVFTPSGDRDPWTESARHGWLGLTVHGRDGGLGLGETEAVLLAEQLGVGLHDTAVVEHLTAAEILAAQAPLPDGALTGDRRLGLGDLPGNTAEGPAWWLRLSAHLLGTARRAIGLAAAHSRRRHQFDGPIARFQGVILPLAAHSARVDGLRLRLYQLAGELDRGIADPHVVALFARSVRAWAHEAVGHAVHVFGASGLIDAQPVSTCHRNMLATGTRLTADPDTVRSEPDREPGLYLRTALERRVPREWRTTAVTYHAPDRVHEMVTAAARNRSDEPAVTMPGEETITYAELERRANRLAHLLRAHGATTDSVVGVALPRCVDLVVAVLGVLKSGAGYLPLDPEYPEHRIGFMINDSRAGIVVTQDWFTEWLPESPATVIRMDTDPRLAAQPDAAPSEKASAESLAYVIYTSGSTGEPKGVEIAHRGLVNRLRWDQDTFPLGSDDAVLQHTSICFDIAAMEIFGALVSGARVVLAPLGAEGDPAALVRTIIAERITTLPLVPSLLDVLLEERSGLKEATHLRYLFSGGEALSPELCRRVFTAVPWAELHNFYGPSEASVDVTSWHCTPENVVDGVPIGVPLSNVDVYIVDDTGVPVPRGAVGELLVGGAGIARGYRHRPELTRERFLPDPFADDGDTHLYRTGDLARYREDGAIEFAGRVDEQVKVRGFRIEPGEIEAALERLDTVRQAVVKPVENVRLEAFVTVFTPGVRGEDLLTDLRERLPEHMVPGHVEILSAFPLMPNGKIDRGALARSGAGGGGTGVATGLEGMICALMAEVLNQPSVDPAADFFDIGGTSLQAARFVARVRNSGAGELRLGEFIHDPTCVGVVRRLEKRKESTAS